MSILLVLSVPALISIAGCAAGYTVSVIHPRIGRQDDNAS